GGARTRLTVEEHGEGRQLLRYCVWPYISRAGVAVIACLLALVGLALALQNEVAAVGLGAAAGLLALRVLHECAATPPVLEALAALSDQRATDRVEALATSIGSRARRVESEGLSSAMLSPSIDTDE